MLQPGAVFAGYRIEGLIDRGGMGVVYRATDVDLDRTVALKIIAPEHTQNPDAVARFKSEAKLAASIEHANIVPIHRGGEYDGVLYLAMRLVPGTNLRQVIDEGPLPMERIRRVTTQIADALDAAHARGLVHRDVKPANIMVSGEGKHEHVYLTDFGLTKRLGTAGSLTRTGGWVGTPDYVAPEQIQAGRVDGRADVYSLGCVLYEMLTGTVAFPRDNDVAKLWAHVTDPPPPPSLKRPDLVKTFDEVVARATAKDPDARYQKASELAVAVDGAVAEQEGKSQAALSDAAGARPEWTVPASGQDEVFVADPTYVPGASAPGQGSGAPSPPPSAAPAQASAPPPPPASVPQQASAPPPDSVPPQATAPPPQPPAAGTQGPPAPPPERRRGAGRFLWPVAAGVALIVGVVAVVVLGSGSSDDDSSKEAKPTGRLVSGKLAPVPKNKVDGVGKVDLRLNGNVATVTLHANGLLNNAPHAMHIHAGAAGQCPPASAATLHNGHSIITADDGAPYYGRPRVSLTTEGPTGPASILAFQRYPAEGDYTYKRRIELIPSARQFIRKNNAVVVVHGIDYNGNALYDGTLDRSDLDPTVQGETTAPALCGPIRTAPGGSAKNTGPGSEHVYTATLSLQPAANTLPSWVCHLVGATS